MKHSNKAFINTNCIKVTYMQSSVTFNGKLVRKKERLKYIASVFLSHIIDIYKITKSYYLCNLGLNLCTQNQFQQYIRVNACWF